MCVCCARIYIPVCFLVHVGLLYAFLRSVLCIFCYKYVCLCLTVSAYVYLCVCVCVCVLVYVCALLILLYLTLSLDPFSQLQFMPSNGQIYM